MEEQACKHGVVKGELCDACELEKQPSWNTIENLRKKSHFKRSNEVFPNCFIEIENKKFKIEIIENGKDPSLSDVQALFENTFGKEEVDPEEILRSAVDGITPWETEDTKYRVVTIRDDEGKLVTTVAGASLDLFDEKGEPTGECAYYVGYAVTDPNTRQGGLAREAYISALLDVAREAQKKNKVLKFAVGECTYTSEKFWNNVGWKRVYAQTGDKREYTELKYIQPALEFDEDTGEIAEGSGEAPEHLMIDAFGPKTPGKEDVMRAYESLIYFCNDWPREAFNNDRAEKKKTEYLNGIKTNFKDFMDSNGQLIYLDADNREKAVKEGVAVIGYTEADRGQAGEEDF